MNRFYLNNIQDYEMFYVLKSITAGTADVVLYHQQTNDLVSVPREQYDTFLIGETSVLVAFKDVFIHTGKHNYIASDGITEEIVQTNPYERVTDYYESTDFGDNGVFVFLDSRPVMSPNMDWRCDNALYGPRPFYRSNTPEVVTLSGAHNIKVYEPILSINGIGHIIYFHYDGDDSEIRFNYINNAETPQAAETLTELLRLLWEWSVVSDDPFNNTERIARAAKAFINAFNIDYSMFSGCSEMQVSKFLNGNTQARQRTNTSYEVSPTLDKLILTYLPYMLFSNLIKEHSEYFDLSECVNVEKAALITKWGSSLTKFRADTDINYLDIPAVLESIEQNNPGALGFATLYYRMFDKKAQLLDKVIA